MYVCMCGCTGWSPGLRRFRNKRYSAVDRPKLLLIIAVVVIRDHVRRRDVHLKLSVSNFDNSKTGRAKKGTGSFRRTSRAVHTKGNDLVVLDMLSLPVVNAHTLFRIRLKRRIRRYLYSNKWFLTAITSTVRLKHPSFSLTATLYLYTYAETMCARA